jgi:cyanate lyase
VYGGTMKELIEETFGAGIMSAIDFTMDIEKVPDPKG